MRREILNASQAETLDKQFEKPLRQHLENYRYVVNVRIPLFGFIHHDATRAS